MGQPAVGERAVDEQRGLSTTQRVRIQQEEELVGSLGRSSVRLQEMERVAASKMSSAATRVAPAPRDVTATSEERSSAADLAV